MREYKIVRAGVGRKFQNPSIYENLTVFENLEMSYPAGRKVFGALFFKRTAEVIARVEEVAREIFLGDRCNNRRTAVPRAEAVAGDRHAADAGPRVADARRTGGRHERRERELTAELLKRICQGRSVIVIEHDMEFVKRIAHKVTVLHQGKILAEGSMESVQADPKVIEVYLGH
jgi:urea transport system ATP-binding protein